MRFIDNLNDSFISNLKFFLEPEDNQRLNNLLGPINQHITKIEEYFHVKINIQSHQVVINAAKQEILDEVKSTIQSMYKMADNSLSDEDVNHYLKNKVQKNQISPLIIQTRSKSITGKTKRQNNFIKSLETSTINFAIGPAGTGKTYLGVAKAVELLESAKIDKLIFVRPAVEAGERLGFLPGDMIDKVQPYLRPIYDVLYELLGVEQVQKMIQNDSIEIAPLAFMRGRSLNKAFIMLDEAQNTTIAQMKMFLTRLGFGSQMVITGDQTQTDLPTNTPSGLPHAVKLMRSLKHISVTEFKNDDIIRHNLVSKIIQAYDKDQTSK